MIKIRGLEKEIAGKQILKGLDLNVVKGSIYGLIGHNASGKTSLIKHMVEIYSLDKGSIEIFGQDIVDNIDLKNSIAYISDNLVYPYNYRIRDYRDFYRDIYRNFSEDRYGELLEFFHLDQKAKLKDLSKGQKAMVQFLLGLSTSPDLLIMDEAFSGIDALVKRKLLDLIIEEVATREMTVLMTSHNISDLEKICDSLGFLREGRLILEGELDSIKSGYSSLSLVLKNEADQEVFKELKVLRSKKTGKIREYILKEPLERVEKAFESRETLIFDLSEMSLEEIFLLEMEG